MLRYSLAWLPAALRHGLAWLWALLPAIALLAFVLAVFVVDPAAVVQLAWASATGAFGRVAQVGTSAFLLIAVTLTLWAFWPEASAPPARRTRTPRATRTPGATRRRTQPAESSAGEAQPQTDTPAPPAAVTPVVVLPPATPTAAADAPAASAASAGAEPGKQRRRPAQAAARDRQRSGALAGQEQTG